MFGTRRVCNHPAGPLSNPCCLNPRSELRPVAATSVTLIRPKESVKALDDFLTNRPVPEVTQSAHGASGIATASRVATLDGGYRLLSRG